MHSFTLEGFVGRLLGVSEKVLNSIADLFTVNERILVTGQWKHGFFSMTAVGATNVGAIELDFDVSLYLYCPAQAPPPPQ